MSDSSLRAHRNSAGFRKKDLLTNINIYPNSQMLDIEKQQKRFQDKSLKEMIDEYERHFVKQPEEEKPPPNSPYPPEDTGDLFKEKGKDKQPRGDA